MYVGLDVHEKNIEVVLAMPGRRGEVSSNGSITNDLHSLKRLISKLRNNKRELIATM